MSDIDTAAVLNTIAENLKTLSANQKHLLELFQKLDGRQSILHDCFEGIEFSDVDSYPFRDRFERLCQDVADLKKQEGN